MSKDHHNFIREKCNADRTVRQIVNDMQQMSLIGSNLNKNDLFRFELEVNPLKRKVQNAVREFVDVCDKFQLTDDKIRKKHFLHSFVFTRSIKCAPV